MSARQLHLFESPKPLLLRLGEAFFKTVPAEPGVYLMRDASEAILYVGQSKNLRQRLFCYKNARPGNVSRKVLRLLCHTEAIEWECCATPESARLRENQLLRLHRPRFNIVNTWPQRHFLISLQASNEGLTLLWSRDLSRMAGDVFGSFHSGCLHGYGAMLRLLHSICQGGWGHERLPRRLLGERPPDHWPCFVENKALRETVSALLPPFLAGDSDALVDFLQAELTQPEAGHFERCLLETELDSVRRFFQRGPQQNRAFKSAHGIRADWIGQELLDDLFASEPPQAIVTDHQL